MELIDQSSDAGFHHCDFEIHQQTNRVSGKLEISYQLSFMNWENSFDGLEFDYDWSLAACVNPTKASSFLRAAPLAITASAFCTPPARVGASPAT